MEATRDLAQRAEHLAAAERRLPGPGYYHVLRWIHEILRPANYVEIGVHRGISLVQALRGTPCIAVDPEPSIDEPMEREIERKLPATRIYELTSDGFFARYDLRDLLGGAVELAFIDGLHLFEQVLRDFAHLERYAAAGTVFLLHDCLPLDEVTASRERTTDFYCGDVWKAALALRRRRPELEMVTVRTAPTGLCLVRGLDNSNRGFEEELPEIEETYRDVDFEYYLAHRQQMPPEMPNEEEAVRDWLTATPVS
jgi:Methyltransferase domain